MDSHMGWTNSILSLVVDKVCLAYPDDSRKGGKYLYTGRPLRPALLTATREEGLARFGLAADRPVLLVFGGSLGAHALNVVALEAYAQAKTPFQILHVTGELDYSWVADTLARPGANPSYQAHAFLDDFPLAMAAADAVVARAGGSVAEILARGIPALLVPYPYAAGDHQTKNACRLSEAGAALMVTNADLDAKSLTRAVTTLLDPVVNGRMREAALKLAIPDATIRIADVVVELLARRAE
jgi:UDP-N-acetylglucosamine--N-acetylmuramyl-(pentapeptide) pyrophosphoryl-undecaprenol N-acetylglucosamine transferase